MKKIFVTCFLFFLALNLEANNKPGFWGIPFGTEKSKAIEMMSSMDSVKVYENCPWPVPDGDRQTHVCFKSTQFLIYDIRYIVFIFEDGKFDIAYVMLRPPELEWYRYIIKDMDKIYGEHTEKKEGFHWRKDGMQIIAEVLKFPREGQMKDHVFITFKRMK